MTDATPRLAAERPLRGKDLAVFLAVGFGFSWLPWLGVIASSRGWIPWRVPLTPFGSFGPALGALCALALSREEGALRRWLASVVRWRVPAWTILAAVFLPPAAAASAFLAAVVFSGVRVGPKLPGPGFFLAACLEILVLGGPLGEEPGWRGYLLARLRRSIGAGRATVLVAALWFLWHVPLFWVPGSSQREIPPLLFALAIASEAVLLTWIFESASNSTLAAALAHASLNATFLFASMGILERHQNDLFWPLYLGFLVAAAGLVLWRSPIFRRPTPP